ncbi:translation initiation factor eIF-2B subunit gamma [Eurytemora carolleeae]|uniref:translation initiation factor eIF-2B subunit gamma n=1 Tax=Eurytemora carolleeae TaxID=1294199 RepID=UPI000C755DB4|nr:translation initiation factor eIF-2B subunit gamma [Eurytemora carolleeae]|eukprot:XP_023330677.1 translation initiation factor eIF-2B subunit gamma-like [Eurytemora affinis]
MGTGEIQAVVMAAGKGSRMLDITGGGVKCLIPLGGYPLLYYPLKMLERSGFRNVIVTVPDSARSEVCKFAEKYKLSLKLDVVGVPMAEEWGTMDTLRHISDKLVGSDILIVSGDLVSRENCRILSDLHRSKKPDLTLLLNKPAFDLKSLTVPGSKSTKYKNERDLIGLSGNNLCLFKSEADVEEEINISNRVLRQCPRFTVHTNLQDSHLYIVNKETLDQVLQDKSVTAVKGEMIPKLVSLQFNTIKGSKEEKMEMDNDFHGEKQKQRSLKCYAAITEETTVRVNNVPSYWDGFRIVRSGFHENSELPVVHEQAKVHEKSQMKDCSVGAGSVVSEKTTLTGVSVGANCTIHEKVRISNCIIMDGVTIASGSNIKDCIVCEGASLEAGCDLSNCIVGRQHTVSAQSNLENQILLDSDRMMHV